MLDSLIRPIETSDPSAEIRKVLSSFTSPRIENLPPFTTAFRITFISMWAR